MTNAPASASPVRALLEELRSLEAWAVVRQKDSPTVSLIGGRRSEVAHLLDIPLEAGVPLEGRQFDRLVAVPFRQVAERGFDPTADGTPLVVGAIAVEHPGPVDGKGAGKG